MRVGLDLDGVLADFDRQWRTKYLEWFGGELPDEFLPFGEAGEAWLREHTVFDSEDAFWLWTDHVPGFWATIPTVPGAMGAVYQLQAAGHELVLITSRHKKTRLATQEWVSRNFPRRDGRLGPQIHHTYKTQKGAIDCQVYVDDNPAVLEALSGKPCVLIFDQPWNRDVKSTTRLHRVRGWGETERFIRRLAAGDETVKSEGLAAELAAAGKEPVQ